MPISAIPTVQMPILSILAVGFCKTLFKQTPFILSVLQAELCGCAYTGHVCYMCVCVHLGTYTKVINTVLSQWSFVVSKS